MLIDNPKPSKIQNQENSIVIQANLQIENIENGNKSNEFQNNSTFHRGNTNDSNVAQRGESSLHMSAYRESSSSKLLITKIEKLNNQKDVKVEESKKIEGEILECPGILDLMNKKFIINEKGLEGSERNAKDSYSYFGTGIVTVKINRKNLKALIFLYLRRKEWGLSIFILDMIKIFNHSL